MLSSAMAITAPISQGPGHRLPPLLGWLNLALMGPNNLATRPPVANPIPYAQPETYILSLTPIYFKNRQMYAQRVVLPAKLA